MIPIGRFDGMLQQPLTLLDQKPLGSSCVRFLSPTKSPKNFLETSNLGLKLTTA